MARAVLPVPGGPATVAHFIKIAINGKREGHRLHKYNYLVNDTAFY